MAAIRRILVAIKDPDARSQPTLRKAAQLAHALGAGLQLFHALTEPVYVDAVALAGHSLKGLQARAVKSRLAKLERLAATLRADGLRVDVSCAWDFPAYEAVVRCAERRKADLIVAERHAQKHVAPWLLRFNDWELLRRSRLPVLLVKSPRPYARRPILAAIDPGHTFAKPARLDAAVLQAGARLATALRASLHVVHSYESLPVTFGEADLYTPQLAARVEAQTAAQATQGMRRALEGQSIPRSRQHLVSGRAENVIPALAAKLRTGILVMGAVSRSGLRRLLIGNTAERILDTVSCDVLVIKPAQFKARVKRARRGLKYIATPLAY
jgi:universal stress protein E